MTSHASHAAHGVHAAHAPSGSRRHRGVLVAVVAAVVLLALCGATYGVLHSRLFAATTIVVSGEHHESALAIERAAGLAGAPAMLSVSPSSIALRLESAFPWIAGATVTRSWPHTVRIVVTERVPVAAVATHSGALELVDVTGRRLGPERTGQTLPILEYAAPPGQAAPSPQLLAAAAEPGLIVASTLPPAFAWQVSTIQVGSTGWVTLHLDTPVTFLLGPANDLGAKYEDIAAVIARTILHAGDVVDVSVPQAMTVTGP